MPKCVTSADVVKLLNEIHKLDPSVVKHFVCDRIRCNDSLAEHPSVQVGPDNEVGLVGILNGLFQRPDGSGEIAALTDEDGSLVGFELTENLDMMLPHDAIDAAKIP